MKSESMNAENVNRPHHVRVSVCMATYKGAELSLIHI